ncbi:hypothetical protein ABH19_06505 [Leptospirillum sp. Group II 'CF-1']|nr:hypothetical protein ABH19_06505 [Leptospirillum sp. Group II 'CF-1']
MLQSLQKTDRVQKKKLRPLKHPLGGFGVISMGGFIAGLIIADPWLGWFSKRARAMRHLLLTSKELM